MPTSRIRLIVPAYQQNDYISWIVRAKLPETRAKRLKQMLEELQKRGVYMKMKHSASKKGDRG
ncbi:bacteriocin-protection protein, YdeI/OmpD-associated domain protein [Leptospira wolffii serovar Khorat str. Khorat-H2]|nr:bacteriocin-protection protein, YdeI/OmpD-associated domain protein [Leptospira wolffii serovar Khorat str. Khorat-H2]